MELLQGVATGAPVWVWPLLALLIFVGYRSSKARSIPITLVYLLPLLGVFTLETVHSLPVPAAAWTGFGLGYILGIFVFYRWQENWLVGLEGRSVLVAGEWITLAILMVIFWANFVSETIKAISYGTYESALFGACFAAVLGFASGSFLGRSVRTMIFVRNSQSA